MFTPQLVGWISEDPARSDREDASEPKSRPRRVHTKSRHGCQNCKKRRVKCDEGKPKCSRCFDLRLQCTFPGIEDSSDGYTNVSEEEVNPEPTCQQQTKARVILYLKEEGVHCPLLPTDIYDPQELLDHFIDTKFPWVGSSECQRIMQKHALQLSLSARYLLHAILAFSASHLSYLYPNENKYAIAAASHLERSLNLYSLQLKTRVDKSNADSIYACCYLHSMLALRNVYLTSMERSSDSTGGYALGWLRAMQGTRVLREHISDQEVDLWLPVCIEARTEETYITYNHSKRDMTDSAIDYISTELHKLCGVDLDLVSPVLNNPYQQPLSRLCQLMRCDIGHSAIGMFMVFIGKLPPHFVQLLDNDDPRAMLIMSYWCSLIRRIDQWWIVASAELECARFCRLINKLSDPKIRGLLNLI